MLKKATNTRERLKFSGGFTLVEVIFTLVILGLIAVGVAYPYSTGIKSIDVGEERTLIDNYMRSRMEILVSTDFDSLSNGSQVVSVNGGNYTITWTVVNMDIDGDTVPEAEVKLVTVSVTEVPGSSLTMIRVDNEDRVGKIS